MIRMIVIRAGCNDNVSFPLADLADNLLADFQGRQELAVVVIEDFVFDADASCRFLRFGTPALGEFLSVLRLVTSVAVG